jgi:hypothetical protein
LAVFLFLAVASQRATGQGCIGSPNNPISPIVPGDFTNTMNMAHQWLGTVDYRWYHSFRTFAGDVEQTQTEARGQNPINNVNTFDVAATYGINARWTATLTLPFFAANRSSKYEHNFVDRHTMHASGLGDIRLVTDYFLLDPHKHMEGNISLGAGFKAPTGDAKASDISYRATGPVTRPVDPSIQPGDGGWGIIHEI